MMKKLLLGLAFLCGLPAQAMTVNGPLLGAGFEKISGAPSTFFDGRFYLDTATGLPSFCLSGTCKAIGGGTAVTSVTGTTPVVSSGGTTPAISMAKSTASVDGYLAATDFTIFSAKVPATRAINTTSPLTGGGALSADLTLACNVASGSQAGCLSAADWTTFNSKGSGTGTVTTVSVATANGLAGTVANATSTPAITLTTSVTGVVKGNGTALSAATAGTDYSVGTSANATGIVKSTTSTGALTTAIAADFPTLNQNTTGTAANVTGVVAVANGGTGANTLAVHGVVIGNATSAVSVTSAGTAGFVLTSNGASADPTFQVAGGGGGGGSFHWVEAVNAPISAVDNLLQVFEWVSGLGQTLLATVQVPTTYASGNPIKLKLKFYSPDTSGTVLMQTISTLIRSGTDAVTSTTNQRTSTNTAVTLSAGTVNIPQAVAFDLTSSSGQINSVSVSAGDVIKIQLNRGTDTGVSDVLMPVFASELTIN